MAETSLRISRRISQGIFSALRGLISAHPSAALLRALVLLCVAGAGFCARALRAGSLNARGFSVSPTHARPSRGSRAKPQRFALHCSATRLPHFTLRGAAGAVFCGDVHLALVPVMQRYSLHSVPNITKYWKRCVAVSSFAWCSWPLRHAVPYSLGHSPGSVGAAAGAVAMLPDWRRCRINKTSNQYQHISAHYITSEARACPLSASCRVDSRSL